jgi:hypothetical protein
VTPSDWLTLDQAFARIVAFTGSRQLAERDLQAELQRGRLTSAVRGIDHQGVLVGGALRPTFWEGLTVSEELEMPGIPTGRLLVRPDAVLRQRLGPVAPRIFYISRSTLDALYSAESAPVATAPKPAVLPPLLRRGPGRRPKSNWREVVEREVKRIRRAGEETPTAAEMIDRCEVDIDISSMQKLLKSLRG